MSKSDFTFLGCVAALGAVAFLIAAFFQMLADPKPGLSARPNELRAALFVVVASFLSCLSYYLLKGRGKSGER